MALDIGSLEPQQLAPTSRSGALKPGSHFVQLYDEDAALISSLKAFFSNGLRIGDSVVCIASALHQAAVQEELLKSGIDLDAARRNNTFIALDATEALSAISDEGEPNDALFNAYLGELIDRAIGSEGRHVRMFGEMVALLWAAGRPASAASLEHMWNELAREHPFQLFCAYPVSAFDQTQVELLSGICSQHTHVLPPN